MKMYFNPSRFTDSLGFLKGFFSGSLVVTSFVIGIGTESESVFLGMFALFIIGIIVGLDPLMKKGESLFTVIISWVIGLIISLVLAYMGYAWEYLFIIIVLTVLIYLAYLVKALLKK